MDLLVVEEVGFRREREPSEIVERGDPPAGDPSGMEPRLMEGVAREDVVEAGGELRPLQPPESVAIHSTVSPPRFRRLLNENRRRGAGPTTPAPAVSAVSRRFWP